MKVLAIISLILGAGAVGVGVYALVETHPNYVSAKRRAERGGGYAAYSSRRSSRLAALDQMIYRSYSDALKAENVFGMWGAGGLALVLGLIAGLKGRKLGFIGALLGAAAAVMSIFAQPGHW